MGLPQSLPQFLYNESRCIIGMHKSDTGQFSAIILQIGILIPKPKLISDEHTECEVQVDQLVFGNFSCYNNSSICGLKNLHPGVMLFMYDNSVFQ